MGQGTVTVIVVPGAAYARGNAAFWVGQVGPSARQLANRWIQLPASAARAFTADLGPFAPATISRCLSEDHGTLTVAGKRNVNGRAAVVLKDGGDAPGSTPSTLAVATTGPPYPLQLIGTGPTRRGGKIDVCNDGKGDDVRGTLTFSRFGAVGPIKAPKNAIQPGGNIPL